MEKGENIKKYLIIMTCIFIFFGLVIASSYGANSQDKIKSENNSNVKFKEVKGIKSSEIKGYKIVVTDNRGKKI